MKILSTLFLFFVALTFATACTFVGPHFNISITNQNQQKELDVNYPANTDLIIKDAAGNIIYDSTEGDDFFYEGDFTLIVRPDYKTGEDVYDEKGKFISIQFRFEEPDYDQPTTADYGVYKPSVSATYTVKKSTTNEGKYNLELTYDNGVRFTYTDGNVAGELDGKEIAVKGKYLIYTNLGLAKISFNPNTGKVYYVFEAIEKKKH